MSHASRNDIVKRLGMMFNASSQVHVYALIDGALQPAAWKEMSRRCPTFSLLPEGTDGGTSATAALPFLVKIDGESAAFAMDYTVDLALEHHAATWLTSWLAIDVLAQRLAKRLDAEVPDMQVILRFADARILPAVRDAMNPAQSLTFFSGIASWWYLERNWELTELDIPRDANSSAGVDVFCPPLILSAAQEAQLMQTAEPDSVMALIDKHDPQALRPIPKNQHHAFVKEQMKAADLWGITSASDQALFCMIALEHSPDFHRSEQWQAALQQVKVGHITLTQALEQNTP